MDLLLERHYLNLEKVKMIFVKMTYIIMMGKEYCREINMDQYQVKDYVFHTKEMIH